MLMVLGGLTLGLGATTFSELKRSYREQDLALSESPHTFRLWFLKSCRVERSAQACADRVSGRLNIMQLGQRQVLVQSLMSDTYLKSLWTSDADRRATIGMLLNGVLEALTTSPLDGDLWLAAARLRRRQNGFDEVASRYLEASFRYAPREPFLVVDRLFLAAQVSPLLSDELMKFGRRDYELLHIYKQPHIIDRTEQELRRYKLFAQ